MEDYDNANAAGRQMPKSDCDSSTQPCPLIKQPDKKPNFDISLSLGEETTFVPLGIPAYDGEAYKYKDEMENAFFTFDYKLTGEPIDSLQFNITEEDGTVLYNNKASMVVRTADKQILLKKLKVKEKIENWEPAAIINSSKIAPADHTKPGDYSLFWDGFNTNDIYDSKVFNGKQLTASITATGGGLSITRKVIFKPSYDKDWLDIKINKNTHEIHATLRMKFIDGGEQGLGDGGNVPKNNIMSIFPVLTKGIPFDKLREMALTGLKDYWSRNRNRPIGNANMDVVLNKVNYEFYLDPVESKDNILVDIQLRFNTNRPWERSKNPARVTGIKSFVGNIIFDRVIWYNGGYIKYKSGWQYNSTAEDEYKETAAHEIGHSILQAYVGGGAGQDYSYYHKGSSDLQDPIPGTSYPSSGEIDLMKYAEQGTPDRKRTIAAVEDVLGIIWCGKINIVKKQEYQHSNDIASHRGGPN